MEADLQRWYQIDIRDRWHPEPAKRLTLRRIGVLVKHLPPESAVARIGHEGPVWGVPEFLLADIWQQVARSKKPHPARPQPTSRKRTAAGEAKFRSAHARAAERRRQIAEGVIT